MIQRYLTIFSIALIAFLGVTNSAFADYSGAGWYPSPITATARQTMISGSTFYGVEWQATTTFRMQSASFFLCNSTGNGIAYLEMYLGTGTTFASRLLLATSSSVTITQQCGVSAPYTFATTTFTFPNQDFTGTEIAPIGLFIRATSTSGSVPSMKVILPTAGDDINNYVTYATGGGTLSHSTYAVNWFATASGVQPFGYNENDVEVVCATFDAGCYFSKALSFAFSPSPDSLNQFSTLADDLKYKAPLGYFTSAYIAVTSFSTTSAPVFVLATSSPITAYIFNPVRTGISWLFYFAGVWWLYRRLTHINV